MAETVIVTVSGPTGSGKSAICGEIEIAMRAIGVPVTWDDEGEKNMTHADWQSALDLYKPSVVIVEKNTPRRALDDISPIAADGSLSADWLHMILNEHARFEDGRLANGAYLAVKIVEASDQIAPRRLGAPR